MTDDDAAMRAAIEEQLRAATEEAARLHREIDSIESDLAQVVEMFLLYTSRRDLAVDFLTSLGNPSSTLH